MPQYGQLLADMLVVRGKSPRTTVCHFHSKNVNFFHSWTLYNCIILNCDKTVSQNEAKTRREDMIAASMSPECTTF